ncbi:MAG: hypothetical protein SFU91_05240 [Chloroherpetonaceae bacterium]|nr:hypothetical protein [Chloroherpetonaceae bacterium]
MTLNIFGWLGMGFIMLCWVPQTIQTFKEGRCSVNRGFLYLTLLGSVSLTIHAISLGDVPFILLNSWATTGSGVNLYFSLFPKNA